MQESGSFIIKLVTVIEIPNKLRR